MMKSLFILTAAIEVGAGVAFLIWPSALVTILLGSSLDTPASLTVGRVAGAALLSLGVGCWLAHNDGQSRAATGLVAAMLLYNAAVLAVLTGAHLPSELIGVGFWLVVVVHAVMAIWCIACLWSRERWTSKS